jgi:hypothetical protein
MMQGSWAAAIIQPGERYGKMGERHEPTDTLLIDELLDDRA